MCSARIACHYHPAWRRPARQLREIKIAQFRLSPCRPRGEWRGYRSSRLGLRDRVMYRVIPEQALF